MTPTSPTPASPSDEPGRVYSALLAGQSADQFLSPDLGRIRSAENQGLLLGLLACTLDAAGLPADDLEDAAGHSVGEMRRMAGEVEPKAYGPDERLDDVSAVMRGVARIVNALSEGRRARAARVAGLCAWPTVRALLRAALYAACVRAGDAALAAELRGALPAPGPGHPPEPRPAPGAGAGSPPAPQPAPPVDDADLRDRIEEALDELIPPGTTFPVSRGVVEVDVTRADAAKGTADLHLGVCRMSEDTHLGGFLQRQLTSRVAGLQHVGIAFSEL